MKVALLVICSLFLLFSCGHSGKQDINRMVAEWNGKEIVYPANMVFTLRGQDTIKYSLPHSEYKVVSYIDSVGCTSCKLQLLKWKVFISELDSVSQCNIPVLLFFHPHHLKEVTYVLKRDQYNYPVCIDKNNDFNKLNHFPAEMTFQTFLLDKENKVVAIGNPIHNPKVKDLYLNIIQGRMPILNQKELETEISISEKKISLGEFNWQEEQRAVFTLKNIGKYPLVINSVLTSCGCTAVKYSEKPVPPKDTMVLNISYRAEHAEHFDKTITIHCNVAVSPIRLHIVGNAR